MNYLIEDYNSDHLIKVNNDDENFNMENYSMWIFDGKEYTPSLKLKINASVMLLLLKTFISSLFLMLPYCSAVSEITL